MKDCYPGYIQGSHNSVIRRQISKNFLMISTHTKEDIQRSNMHIKHQGTLVIIEIKFKTIIR